MMSSELRAEYDWWTATAPRYGFGRIDVAPIHSNAEAIRKYFTKTEWRHDHWVFQEVERLRFWGCSKSLKSGSTRFSWNTVGGQAGRTRMAAWAASQGCDSREALRALLGPTWGFQYFCATSAFSTHPAAPRSYLLVPAAQIEKMTGEAASDSPSSRTQTAGRVLVAEGFEGLGRGEDKQQPPRNPGYQPVPAAPSLRQSACPNPTAITWRRGPHTA